MASRRSDEVRVARIVRSLRPRLAAGFALAALCGGAYLLRWAPLTPLPSTAPEPELVVVDARGEVVHRAARDGLRIPVPLEAVAPAFLEAVVATEDQRFWMHPGVDPLAVARAIARLPFERSGASTVTMQVARRRYLQEQRQATLLRKPREALLALQLDARYSKAELLEAYVNDAYFGRHAYGVEAAARTYFGIPAAQLDRAQASFLAGLIQRPGLAASGDAPDARARARQRQVLDRLVVEGRIAPAEAGDAAAAPLRFAAAHTAAAGGSANDAAARFVEYVHEELARDHPDLSGRAGLVIETTLDAALQREAARAAQERLQALREQRAGGAAVVALRPEDGAILVLASEAAPGSAARDVNMAIAPRQPGSALKPFLYAAAIEHGYTAATPLLDTPAQYESPLGTYTPANYDLRFRGPVTLRVALASSLNVPAVRTLDALGLEPLLRVASRVGLRSLAASEAYGLSLSLGGGEVTPLELTSAYGVLAAGGLHAEPYAIARIRDARGRLLYERPALAAARALDPAVAFILTDILADPTARVAGFGESPVLDTPLRAAVKTGTSSGFTDNWTVGYTREVVVGVWVGNPDGAPLLHVSGVGGAAPLWRAVLLAAHEGRIPRAFAPPPGMEVAAICAPTALLAGAHCPQPDLEWFAAGTAPHDSEAYYRPGVDGRIAQAAAPEARGWAAELGVALVTGDPDAARSAPVALQPAHGAVLHLTPELGRSEVLLRAAVAPGASRVEFRIDGRLVGVGAAPAPTVTWPATLGTHTLAVTAVLPDGSTRMSETRFEVRP